jgi:26S proteasome regulatory subunit N7
LAQLLYEVETNTGKGAANQDRIVEMLTADDMAPMYQAVCEKHGWTVDSALLQTMLANNTTALAAIDAQEAEAAATGGDMEAIDVLLARARYFTKIGDFAKAVGVYDDILGRPKTITSKKLDALMEKCRIALFAADNAKLKTLLIETKKAIEAGGDWDRRNRLKVYEALAMVLGRDFRAAAKLLADCIATFTCVELCSYEQFMLYTVVVAVATMGRTELHKQLIINPQVIAVLRDQPELRSFLHSIYDCEYASFFVALLELLPTIQVHDFVHDIMISIHFEVTFHMVR